jgi:hypothetical protein
LTYQEEEARYFIVQFNGPVYKAQKDWLAEKGFTCLFPAFRYGFVGRLKNRADLNALRANPSVVWVGIYQPAYKISSLFAQVGEEIKTSILLFLDQDINEVLNNVQAITGRVDFEISDNGINKIIKGVVDKKYLSELAKIPGVYWMEPYFPMRFHNNDVQWVVQTAQTNNRRIWSMGIFGSRELDELVNTIDSGINVQHNAHRTGSLPITTWGYFPNHNAIVVYDSAGPYPVFGDGVSSSYHGTHTAGTLTGYDIVDSVTYDGVARQTRIYVQDVGDNMGGLGLWADLNYVFDRPYNRYYPPARAHLSSNSWGSWVAGTYTAECMEVDQFMWGHKDFCIFFSIGNSGPGAGTVNSPATAKNCVSVGASGNGANLNTLAGYSSRGPTTDGRYKPTICTPGDVVISSTSGTNTYGSMSGTSMASPGACGCGALVREYLREGWYPYGKKVAGDAWSYISAAMVKAVLINSADNFYAGTAPNNNIGWGRVDLDSTLYFAGDNRKLLLTDNTTGLLTAERVDYYFDIPDSAKNLKIALVWTDYPGNPAVMRQIVNDLDLSVYIGATYYRGNQYSSGQSIPNPADRDSINVEECVRVNDPTGGMWRVAVEGRNVAAGPQPFSLVITYVDPGAGTAGVITLDKSVYRANDFATDTVRIRVEDTNFGSPSTIDSLPVEIYSVMTEIRPETIWCLELAESSYVFKGETPLRFNIPSHNDGALSVCQGDTVTALYHDEDPIFNATAWAGIDADYFLINNVYVDSVTGDIAFITWQTNENANQAVYFGTSPGLGQAVQIDTPYTLFHRVKLAGLNTRTTYYYDVESRDFRGNRVWDDNNGNHFTFTTQDRTMIDILVALADGLDKSTSQGNPLPDLRKRFRKAIEKGGWSYDWWETSDYYGALPPSSVMANYKAVFIPNEDEYPPFLTEQMDTIRVYEEGGGRIAFSSHDLLWYSWDPVGGNPTIGQDSMWCKNYLQARYKGDITTTGTVRVYGVTGDPVTGPFMAGVLYSPHRFGADGDTVVGINNPTNGWDAGGVSSNIWRWNAAGGNIIGVKWESGQTHGSPGQGVWGGQKTRTIYNAFSITQSDTIILPDILNREFVWLIGHDHPDVWITSPVTGQTYPTSPVIISWYDSIYGGAVIDSTRLEYSTDHGQAWILIACGTGMVSPYSWDVSGLTNGSSFRVRIIENDRNRYPTLRGLAATGDFTIQIPGNDHIGPRIIAQSIQVSRNPVVVTASDTVFEIAAALSDSLSGLSAIRAATWSIGSNPAPPGYGGPMRPIDGAFDEVKEGVIDTVRFQYAPGSAKICTLWVRGQDSLGNWGNASWRTFTLFEGEPIPISVQETNQEMPFYYALFAPYPNPFKQGIVIGYALPKPGKVTLKLYNCLGQLIRIITENRAKPGVFRFQWDGRDELDRRLSGGVYFVRLTADGFSDTRKMVLIH